MKWYVTSWGPSAWYWLHNSTTSEELISTLPYILPCGVCRSHMTQYISSHPITTPTHKWLEELHNDINQRNGKPIYVDNGVKPDRKKAIIGFTEFMYIVALVHDESELAKYMFKQGCRELLIPYKYRKRHTLLYNIHRTLEKHGYNRSMNSILSEYIPKQHQKRYEKESNNVTPFLVTTICIESIVLFGCIIGLILARNVTKVSA